MQEIRRLREEKRWGQKELAFHAHLSQSVISEIETGKRSPSARTLQKLAGALGVEVRDLFPLGQVPLFREPPEHELPSEERRAAWESAVENARDLRESGQTRMTELLSLWRASRERQEDADARLEYRNEMADLLTQAHKAGTDLFRNFTGSSPEARRAFKEATKAGAREVPNADWEEFLEADRFYYRLLGMVEGQQGLFVGQGSKQNAFEIAEEAA
jgi:transcriptional regulator with XRE-family HTH domain